MEQVVFENVEMLIQYGFRRFLFFNQHGGNNIVQRKLVHRINHNTEAIAIPIGVGSALKAEEGTEEFFDWHAGKSETSMLLYLKPQLVRMERAEQPEIHFTSQMKKLRKLSEENPDLIHLWKELFGVPEEAKKGGASHQISNNGIWSLSDPKSATKELGEKKVNWKVHRAVKFIEAWNHTKK
jgi:creatinine amidohydrolase/Fe(II)-dependent formamide hydrolase-like protein